MLNVKQVKLITSKSSLQRYAHILKFKCIEKFLENNYFFTFNFDFYVSIQPFKI
jgi:hypothetical protein